MKLLSYVLKQSLLALLSLVITSLIIISAVIFYLSSQLPDIASLNDPQLQVPLKIYTHDDKLLAVYGSFRRSPVPLSQVPKPLINAILATEDQRYYEHPGIDLIGLVRATRELLITGQKSQGASTITMQVARNFFLTRKKTYSRKLNEMLLALKIDRELPKDKILELYLNKIYLGQRSYGVAAAAQVYYGKTLAQLTLPEMAMIGGLPQAPSRDNPISNPRGAIERRNHVLQRMYELGYIDRNTYLEASEAPDTARYHEEHISIYAPYVAEMARVAMVTEYGDKAYTDGFKVYTTIESNLQNDANQALRNGLLAYDQRHGYRGPEGNLGQPSPESYLEWQEQLQDIPVYNGLFPAAVTAIQDQTINALLPNGRTITIPWSGLSWARRAYNNEYLGPSPSQGGEIVKLGDVIRVQRVNNQWQLSQVPKVEGALIAMNPSNGALFALTGGFSFGESHYNRAIQALRQPGSNFKPFYYSAALEKGFTWASIINDAPIVEEHGGGDNRIWRPMNDDLRFYGPTRLRVALINSYNLASIRLLKTIGLHYALDHISHFGFSPSQLPHGLSLALGSGTVTPLQIVSGYAVFANGGYRITPYFIDHITNEDNQIIYQAQPPLACEDCTVANSSQTAIPLPTAPRAISPQNAYLMTSVLKDVIRSGTGRGALTLRRPDLAGKTGTSNNFVDAWFSGFNSDIAATAWIGFDNPESLHEFGAQAALPVWVNFMNQALVGQPQHTMAQPPGIITARIDPTSGLLAYPGQTNAIFEVFEAQFVPSHSASPTPDTPDANENPDANSDASSDSSPDSSDGGDSNTSAELF
ncbi:MAG: penicillin-binding protein 1A [Gammaproteobacteria bacterium]